MAQGGSKGKVSNSLVALSSAAVLAVYSAGYFRTRQAADRFAVQAAERRPVIPAPAAASPAITPVEAPAAAAPLAPEKTPVAKRPALPEAPEPAAAAVTETAPVETQPAAAPVVETPASPTPAPTPVAVVEPAPASAPAAPATPAAPIYKDGTYTGWGSSRHGSIQAAVLIENGRISSATIAQCMTRYSCNVISALPPEVAQRQSPEVDYVSGATQSANAFYYAVVEALSKAK